MQISGMNSVNFKAKYTGPINFDKNNKQDKSKQQSHPRFPHRDLVCDLRALGEYYRNLNLGMQLRSAVNESAKEIERRILREEDTFPLIDTSHREMMEIEKNPLKGDSILIEDLLPPKEEIEIDKITSPIEEIDFPLIPHMDSPIFTDFRPVLDDDFKKEKMVIGKNFTQAAEEARETMVKIMTDAKATLAALDSLEGTDISEEQAAKLLNMPFFIYQYYNDRYPECTPAQIVRKLAEEDLNSTRLILEGFRTTQTEE